jgi:hypothetical protein
MFKQLVDSLGVTTYNDTDMVLGIDPNGKASGDLEELAMRRLTKRQRNEVQAKGSNPIQLLKTVNPRAFNSDAVLSMIDRLSDYNLLFVLYDDPVVYEWSWQHVQELLLAPPDPVLTIMSTRWMNPWAVTTRCKLPMSLDQWLNGLNPGSLQAVRDYFTSEDPWVLRTAPTSSDVAAIFKILYKKGWVTKKGDHWIPNKKHRKNAPKFLDWQKHKTKFDWFSDINPSFSQLAVEDPHVPPGEFPKCVEVGEMPQAYKSTLFVGLSKWDLRACPPDANLCEYSVVDRAIFGKNIYSRVVFVTRSNQVRYQLDLPHNVYPTTRLGAAAGFVQRCIQKRLKKDDLKVHFLILVVS